MRMWTWRPGEVSPLDDWTLYDVCMKCQVQHGTEVEMRALYETAPAIVQKDLRLVTPGQPMPHAVTS